MWVKMPVVKMFTDLGFNGLLLWDAPPPATGANVSLIPYTKTAITQDKENNQLWKGTLNAGFDVKEAVLKSMSLDATINPDFSQGK